MEPKRLAWWQKPEYSPLVYGVGAFLLADGYPIIEYLIKYLNGEFATLSWDTILRGLGMTILMSGLAWAKNRGKKTVTLAPQIGTGAGETVTTGATPNIAAGSQVTMLQ